MHALCVCSCVSVNVRVRVCVCDYAHPKGHVNKCYTSIQKTRTSILNPTICRKDQKRQIIKLAKESNKTAVSWLSSEKWRTKSSGIPLNGLGKQLTRVKCISMKTDRNQLLPRLYQYITRGTHPFFMKFSPSISSSFLSLPRAVGSQGANRLWPDETRPTERSQKNSHRCGVYL